MSRWFDWRGLCEGCGKTEHRMLEQNEDGVENVRRNIGKKENVT